MVYPIKTFMVHAQPEYDPIQIFTSIILGNKQQRQSVFGCVETSKVFEGQAEPWTN